MSKNDGSTDSGWFVISNNMSYFLKIINKTSFFVCVTVFSARLLAIVFRDIPNNVVFGNGNIGKTN